MGQTLTYLPDGQPIFPPEDPHNWSEGEVVTFDKLSHDVGQVGAFYAARPMFQGLATSATSCALGRTQIGLQTEIIDSTGGHSTTTNNSQYVVPQTGNSQYPVDDYYLCIGYIPFSTTDAADSFTAQVVSTGTGGKIRSGMSTPSGAGHNIDLMVVDIIVLTGVPSGGPYIHLDAYSGSTTNVNTVTSGKCASLTIRWIGCNRTYTTVSPNPTAHSWIAQDEVTADATGASAQSPGVKVPLNREIASNVQFYNSPPICRINAQNSTQTIPSSTSTWTAIQFPIVDIDNFSGWSSGTNTRYTCQRAGLYFVSGCAQWIEATSTAGYRACRLRVNGDNTKVYGGNTILPVTGTNQDSLAIYAVALIQMNVGDYVELQMQQNQGAALAIDNSSIGANMIAVWQSL